MSNTCCVGVSGVLGFCDVVWYIAVYSMVCIGYLLTWVVMLR